VIKKIYFDERELFRDKVIKVTNLKSLKCYPKCIACALAHSFMHKFKDNDIVVIDSVIVRLHIP